MSTVPHSAFTGACLFALAVYENVRRLPKSSLHITFNCQLFGILKRDPVVASLRYFNKEKYDFGTMGAMIVSVNITKRTSDMDLHLLFDKPLVDVDFSIIGDIYWICSFNLTLAINEAVDFMNVTQPMISVCSVITENHKDISDKSIYLNSNISTFHIDTTQYTLYATGNATLLTLPIKAFFRHDNAHYTHNGPPLPHCGKIVYVNGPLYNVIDGPDGEPSLFIIEVKNIDPLADESVLPVHHEPPTEGLKHNFALNPFGIGTRDQAQTLSAATHTNAPPNAVEVVLNDALSSKGPELKCHKTASITKST
ncbi:hypothetical protein A0H81_02895 [Grifola frondosa]|uniref:Uncharacterized protein n=1 Tax=Grifola frondosa TaxID=5627 RepID=A0A1C7ML94_GRIFR|nr:hypothetical protein A0H81_02895 [Grifola frondosa]